jgi:tetratricopeptide (TPR) repeat protein
MTLEQAFKKANRYSNKNLHFSELKYWKIISEKTGYAYCQLRYADSLRLCGFSKKSENVFLLIDVNKIKKENQHLYYIYLGHLYKDIGKDSKAILAYKKALKLNPNITYPYIYLACLLKQQEKDKEAIKYLKIALTKNGDIDEVNYNLATAYLRLGQFKTALQAINKCLLIDSKYPNAKSIKKDIEELINLPKDKIIY